MVMLVDSRFLVVLLNYISKINLNTALIDIAAKYKPKLMFFNAKESNLN